MRGAARNQRDRGDPDHRDRDRGGGRGVYRAPGGGRDNYRAPRDEGDGGRDPGRAPTDDHRRGHDDAQGRDRGGGRDHGRAPPDDRRGGHDGGDGRRGTSRGPSRQVYNDDYRRSAPYPSDAKGKGKSKGAEGKGKNKGAAITLETLKKRITNLKPEEEVFAALKMDLHTAIAQMEHQLTHDQYVQWRAEELRGVTSLVLHRRGVGTDRPGHPCPDETHCFIELASRQTGQVNETLVLVHRSVTDEQMTYRAKVSVLAVEQMLEKKDVNLLDPDVLEWIKEQMGRYTPKERGTVTHLVRDRASTIKTEELAAAKDELRELQEAVAERQRAFSKSETTETQLREELSMAYEANEVVASELQAARNPRAADGAAEELRAASIARASEGAAATDDSSSVVAEVREELAEINDELTQRVSRLQVKFDVAETTSERLQGLSVERETKFAKLSREHVSQASKLEAAQVTARNLRHELGEAAGDAGLQRELAALQARMGHQEATEALRSGFRIAQDQVHVQEYRKVESDLARVEREARESHLELGRARTAEARSREEMMTQKEESEKLRAGVEKQTEVVQEQARAFEAATESRSALSDAVTKASEVVDSAKQVMVSAQEQMLWSMASVEQVKLKEAPRLTWELDPEQAILRLRRAEKSSSGELQQCISWLVQEWKDAHEQMEPKTNYAAAFEGRVASQLAEWSTLLGVASCKEMHKSRSKKVDGWQCDCGVNILGTHQGDHWFCWEHTKWMEKLEISKEIERGRQQVFGLTAPDWRARVIVSTWVTTRHIASWIKQKDKEVWMRGQSWPEFAWLFLNVCRLMRGLEDEASKSKEKDLAKRDAALRSSYWESNELHNSLGMLWSEMETIQQQVSEAYNSGKAVMVSAFFPNCKNRFPVVLKIIENRRNGWKGAEELRKLLDEHPNVAKGNPDACRILTLSMGDTLAQIATTPYLLNNGSIRVIGATIRI